MMALLILPCYFVTSRQWPGEKRPLHVTTWLARTLLHPARCGVGLRHSSQQAARSRDGVTPEDVPNGVDDNASQGRPTNRRQQAWHTLQPGQQLMACVDALLHVDVVEAHSKASTPGQGGACQHQVRFQALQWRCNMRQSVREVPQGDAQIVQKPPGQAVSLMLEAGSHACSLPCQLLQTLDGDVSFCVQVPAQACAES